ncbi:unnamed protein product [Arabis nemorensis]|uniref:RRM domain-containing protein n=1 Tax=Arabis nemorensis TaxID=586526 RepID=A0A565AL40_9BRAS|nr:unnamed protein product [Arabis nemorensis]
MGKGDMSLKRCSTSTDTSLSRDEIKNLLRTRFRRCGEIKRVFVPFECLTGVTVGYDFIDVEDTESALYLNGTGFGEECKIDVMMAKYRMESTMDTMKGCDLYQNKSA